MSYATLYIYILCKLMGSYNKSVGLISLWVGIGWVETIKNMGWVEEGS